MSIHQQVPLRARAERDRERVAPSWLQGEGKCADTLSAILGGLSLVFAFFFFSFSRKLLDCVKVLDSSRVAEAEN